MLFLFTGQSIDDFFSLSLLQYPGLSLVPDLGQISSWDRPISTSLFSDLTLSQPLKAAGYSDLSVSVTDLNPEASFSPALYSYGNHVAQTISQESGVSRFSTQEPDLLMAGEETPVRLASAVSDPLIGQSIVTDPVFPHDHNMINVKKYGAKGDGVTNDTQAIQRALNDGRKKGFDFTGKPKTLFFPEGTYLVKNTLLFRGNNVTLQGAGKAKTVIRLANKSSGFTTLSQPKPVIKTPAGNMSFRQNIWDLSVDTGRGNRGAIGIDYIANNMGSIRNVSVSSRDRLGHSGLSMTRQWPGPLLLKNLEINGFNYGINVAHTEYGPTLENIELKNQKIAGILNNGNTLAIRNLSSNNSAYAIKNEKPYGSIILLDSQLNGGSSSISAIDNKGELFVRNTNSSGYRSTITDKAKVISGSNVSEYVSGEVISLFPSPQRSLNLPIYETPSHIDTDLAQWQKFQPRWYGDTQSLQKVLNSGKSTIYFPFGIYFSNQKATVNVPPTVNRIVGFSSVINGGGIEFKVQGGSQKPLIIEQFGHGVSVDRQSDRPVALKDGRYKYKSSYSGDLYLENVVMPSLALQTSQNIWARQLNIETKGTKIINDGANLWMLGLKTENKGTVVKTLNGGKTEMLGTLVYPVQTFTEEEKKVPAFVNDNSSQSLIYSLSAYANNSNYGVQIEEHRGGQTRKLTTQELGRLRISLFTGYQ